MGTTLFRTALLALAIVGSVRAAPLASTAPRPAAGGETIARCAWDRPGHDPFMGELVPAIDRYLDIPAPVRARLKERMAARRYDDLVEIRRDSIRGKEDYRPEIRDMHFGAGRVCREVTRAAWSDAMRERGLVYCDSGHCILVPTVCRNVSRIDKRRRSAGPPAWPGPIDPVPLLVPEDVVALGAPDPLRFDAPGAGPVPFGEFDPTDFAPPIASGWPPLFAGGSGAPWPSFEDRGGGFVPLPREGSSTLQDGVAPSTGASTPGGGNGGRGAGGGLGGGGSSGGSGGAQGSAPTTLTAPEPATTALLFAGLAAAALGASRRRAGQRRASNGARNAPV